MITEQQYTLLLNNHLDKFKHFSYDIDNCYKIFNLSKCEIIKNIFHNSKFSSDVNGRYDFVTIWGHGVTHINITSLLLAISRNIPILLCEDGFIRSYQTNANKSSPIIDRLSCSMIIDRVGFNYDASRVSDFELKIKDANITDLLIKIANAAINKILNNHISKYNHQAYINNFLPNTGRDKVLVVDLSYDDWSIKINNSGDKEFQEMLNTAIQENPNADIYIKVHPDSIVKKSIGMKRCGYFDNITPTNLIKLISVPINPYSLLKDVNKVYVYSTQLGFEALLCGKEVHTFGTPFYAGWGLTIDKRKFDNRINKTLQEIFYTVYFDIIKWYNPKSNTLCNVNSVLDYMIETINNR